MTGAHAVGLLVPEPPESGRGGAALRWRGIQAALSAAQVRCETVTMRCDRRTRCRDGCGAGPGLRPSAAAPYFANVHCDHERDALTRRLTGARVHTVVCSGLASYRYVSHLSGTRGLRVVYDMHNVEAALYHAMREHSGPRGRFPAMFVDAVARVEQSAVEAADEIWVCSDTDARLLAETYPQHAGKPIRVVPNVIRLGARPPRVQPEHVVFTGALAWYPNQVAARCLLDDVLPRLRRRGSGLPVVIAGSSPDPDLLEHARLRGARMLADPPSTRELIAGGIMTVPLTLGGGSRLKILEAVALGAPVISTAKGAEGLDLEPGSHYLPAESPAEFADRIVRVHRDSAAREAVTARAWAAVRERHSVTALARILDEALG